MRSNSGQAEFTDDGRHVVTQAGPFPTPAGEVDLIWQFERPADASVPNIDVRPIDPEAKEEDWLSAVEAFLDEVRTSATSRNLQTFFYRHLFLYEGFNLRGEFWLPGFRLAPALPDDNVDRNKIVFHEERAIYIDHEVQAIDKDHSTLLAGEVAYRLAARLCLLLDVGLYPPESDLRWVQIRETSEAPWTCQRHPLGFIDGRPVPDRMPRRGSECHLGEFRGQLGKERTGFSTWLECPEELPLILGRIETVGAQLRDAFDACARLYQVATTGRRAFPSVGLTYRVAAVDALAQASRMKFQDFVRAHVPSIKGGDAFLNHLYWPVRSGHIHGGRFPLGDYNPGMPDLTDPRLLERSNLSYDGYSVTRSAIIEWVKRVFL